MWISVIIFVDNYKYYLVIVDLYIQYTWIYPLKQKSQGHDMFVTFKALVESKFKT